MQATSPNCNCEDEELMLARLFSIRLVTFGAAQEAEEEPPEATEFGQSEQAFEVKMLRDMDRSDHHHVDGVAFEPFERDEEDFQKALAVCKNAVDIPSPLALLHAQNIVTGPTVHAWGAHVKIQSNTCYPPDSILLCEALHIQPGQTMKVCVNRTSREVDHCFVH